MPKYLVEPQGKSPFFIYKDAFRYSVASAKGAPRSTYGREGDLCREIFRLAEERDRLQDIVDQLAKGGLDLHDLDHATLQEAQGPDSAPE